jgi:hypothetical protein
MAETPAHRHDQRARDDHPIEDTHRLASIFRKFIVLTLQRATVNYY